MSSWVLVDLRPARESIRTGKLQASKKLTHLVSSFDAVLLIGGLSKERRL